MPDLLRRILRHFGRISVLLAICVAIVGSSGYMLYKHYRKFGLEPDWIATLENQLLDLRFITRGKEEPTGQVGILGLDARSISEFGRWPFPRRIYKQALDNLKKNGVKLIGFDVSFSEPERPLLEDARAQITALEQRVEAGKQLALEDFGKIEAMYKASLGDRALREGVSHFENVVMGLFYMGTPAEAKSEFGERDPMSRLPWYRSAAISPDFLLIPEGKQLSDYPGLMQAYGISGPTEYLAGGSEHFGFFSNNADHDAIVRWITLLRIVDDAVMPSLSLKLAALALNREVLVEFDNHGVAEISLIDLEEEAEEIVIPVDPNGFGRMLVNHRGPGHTLPHISLVDAYHDSFDAQQRQRLKDMVLLMGATATGIHDQRPNPFDPTIGGVEIHATAVDNIIRQDFMRRPIAMYELELYVVLGIGLLFGPLMIYGRALFSGVAVILFLCAYILVDSIYWFGEGTWVYMGVPGLEILSMFAFTTLYKYVVEENERRKVKGAFEHYLSPDVISQVLDDPDSLTLGGEKKELTVFFSDVRGFTTISESLSPEKLCELMNEYFTPMTKIILESRGLLDKYIGDAIMAFWGAPVPLDDQADRACRASLEMLVALDRLRDELPKKGFPKVDIGIGLNTGFMSVGNMGSYERFTYTVMGDAVNLGARLEGLTKPYGVKILISEFTKARLQNPDDFFIRDLDDIRVKGKNEPVKVFEVMRPDLLPQTQAIQDLIGEFEAGRAAYRDKEWATAKQHFNRCMQLRPGDTPAELYLQRVAEFEAQPPAGDWDGVYTFTSK